MKLAQGDIVIVHVPTAFNGSHIQPAIVNRVWGDGDTRDAPQMVNVTALPDCGGAVSFTSVRIRHEKPDALVPGESAHGWLRERDRLADVHPALAAAG